MWCACFRSFSLSLSLSHSLSLTLPLSLVLSGFAWPAWDPDRCLPGCLAACLCVFMSRSWHHLLHHHHLHRLSVTQHLFSNHQKKKKNSEGYEKSRSLSNIAGVVANTLRVSPVTSPYGSPCPLRRSRSPIPSILWDVQLWATIVSKSPRRNKQKNSNNKNPPMVNSLPNIVTSG